MFLAAALGTASFLAHAWDGSAQGRIANISVTGINNYAFRISLEGAPAMCTQGYTWAYLDGNAGNYKVFVATLLMAKARGSKVVAYTMHETGTNYCRIEHLDVVDE